MKLAVGRLVIAVVPLVASGVVMTGCSIHEQTQKWYTPTSGVNADAGDIGLRNIVLIADDDGRATVVTALSNRGDTDDELVGVVVGGATAEIDGDSVEIPAGGRAVISPDENRVDLDDTEAVPGYTIEVEFRFAEAPRTTVEALVLPDDGPYAGALPDAPAPTDASEPTNDAGTPAPEPGETETGTNG